MTPLVRRTALNLALAATAVVTALLALELLLRAFPALLPSGFYGSSQYRGDLLTNVHGSRVIYNKVRRVARTPNEEGFLDVPWSRKKPSETVRVGFFGDSYVEAVQVPLEMTFYRLLEEALRNRNVQTLAFGISGWGTLHSARASEMMAPRYDLDTVVYVFVENDLGDNAYIIQKHRTGRQTPKAYAAVSPDPPGYSIHWVNPPDAMSLTYRIGKAVQNRLLVAQLLWTRIALLRSEGVRISEEEQARSMTRAATGVPNQNDMPSTWPARYSEAARELGRRILRHWRDVMIEQGRRFVVFYVPRGEPQLRGSVSIGTTWLPWLHRTTSELGIPLIDPSAALSARSRAGTEMYDDHWSPAGHRAVAGVLEAHADLLIPGRSGREEQP